MAGWGGVMWGWVLARRGIRFNKRLDVKAPCPFNWFHIQRLGGAVFKEVFPALAPPRLTSPRPGSTWQSTAGEGSDKFRLFVTLTAAIALAPLCATLTGPGH